MQTRQADCPSVFTKDGKLICPNCERTRFVNWYIHCERPSKYEGDLNQVYICPRNRGGCGHCFSPGNRELVSLLIAYLEGKLVIAESEDGNNHAVLRKQDKEVTAA